MSDSTSTNEPLPLDGAEETAAALIDLIGTTRRQLLLYSPLVPATLFGRSDVSAALRQLLIGQSRLQARLLLPPVRNWRADCSQLARLIERLGALELHIPPRDEPDTPVERHYGFVLADQRELLLLNDPLRCLGYRISGGSRCRELLALFTTLWEKSHPDNELRKLGI